MRISDWSSDVCSSDLLDRLQCLVALTNPATEDHHLLELRLHRTVDTQVGEVARQPSDQLGVEHVGRHDEDQHAAVLQQRQRTLIEQLFQPRTALARSEESRVGKEWSVRVDLGGRRIIKKKK